MGLFSKKKSIRKTAKKDSKGGQKKSKDTKKRSSRPKKEKLRESLTQTKSRSHPPTPDKEKEKEKEKEKKKNTRVEDYREKEQDAAKDDDVSKDSQGVKASSPISKPQKIFLKPCPVDRSTLTKVVEKYKKVEKERSQAQLSINVMDEKTKILIDRVTKKPSKTIAGELSQLYIDDCSMIHKAPIEKKKVEESVNFEEDSYRHVPRFVNVRKMPPRNIYTETGVPFWATSLEPNEEEMEGVEEPISINSEHLEKYNNKCMKLVSPETTDVVLSSFQRLSEMKKKDPAHFTPAIVFSNTMRSLVHILDPCEKKEKKSAKKSKETSEKRIKFEEATPLPIVYSRVNPIESIRSIRANLRPQVTPPTKTTTSTSSCDDGV